jgi:hypothetical protein
MSRALFLTVVAAAAAAGAPADPSPPSPAPAAAPHADDPFPIRRLRATEAELPEVRKQLDPGPLVRLPLPEFEDRVRAAGRAAAEARAAPRLAEARYRAALDGADLVGTAEWEVVNPGPGPHPFPLDPLRLGLGPATWDDGREAVVGAAAGEPAAVWVDRPGRQKLTFGWSAAGAAEPGGLRFELRAPPAPAAVLDLDLPAGQVPAVTSAAEGLLTGPFPAAAGRAGWRVRFGGRSRLGLAVRPAGNPGGAAAATLAARYDLAPGQLACAFEYDLRPAKGAVGEWVFAVDPGLRVTDVVANNRDTWAVEPGPADQPRRLRVTLRQPGAGGKVLVTAVAPFPDPARPPGDPLPAVRPAGAVLDEETLSVHLAPGLRVESWSPGDYRLTTARTEPDRTRVLSLAGALLPPGADRPFRRPPAVATSAPEHVFTAAEQVTWHLGPDRAAAAVRVRVRVRRGTVFQLGLATPPGYTFVRATTAPDDLLAAAGRVTGGVAAEFARPLTAGQSAEVTFEFRGPRLAPGRAPFPKFAPVGAAERVGVLGVVPDPAWAVAAAPGAGAVRVGWLDLADPPAPAGAAAAFRYRAGDPAGVVELTPARVAFTAGPAADGALAVRVRAGALPALLAVEAAPADGRPWRVVGGGNAVAEAVPVPLAGLLSPFTPAARGLPGRLWVVRFARPVTGEVTLEGPPVTVLGATATPTTAAQGEPPAPPPAPRAWGYSGLYLVTAVRSPAEVVAVFGGTVTSAAGPVLPVRLPEGAVVRAAAVGGAWLTPGALATSADGVLNLPLPAGGPARFEVRYRLPADAGRVVTAVRSPEPQLPGEPAVGRWWAFAPDVLPGWPVRAWDAGAELPATVGGPPLPGAVAYRSAVEEVRVAPARWAAAAGAAAAAGLLGLAWAAGRRRHPLRAVLVAGGVLAAAAATLVGPPWWERAAAAPLVAGLVGAAGMVVARGRPRAGAAVPLAVAVCALAVSPSVAQAPAPATVVILPKDADGVETVVAPKAVLDRLAVRPAAPGVVLTSADYAVTADDATARVVGKFVAHALGDGDPVLVLPLADARLEKVTVNGSAAFPAAPRPGVYAVPLPGKGRHEVGVRFAVPVTGAGPEREVRFGVPEVPATAATADLPGGARQPQVVGRVGRRDETAGGGRVKLTADVGAVKLLQVRWRDGAGGAAVRVREGCVWDVSPAGAELTAAYLVTVGPGTVSELRFDVPAELDPLGVTVRPLDPGGTAALRDWTADKEQGGFRPLRLLFQGPTGGRLLVVLSLAPRKAVTRQPVLRFPRVVAPGLPAEPDAAYGLRAKDVAADVPDRAFDPTADALTRDFAEVKELRLDPAAPVKVFRPTGAGAELRPTLRLLSDPPAVTTDTAWHFGPGRADAAGTVRWVGKDPRVLLEFTAPGVKVTEVRGAEVAGWAQPGGRVQVWLRRPVREGEVSWSGTAAAPAAFDAVAPRVVDARLAADTVTVRPVEGYAVAVDRDRGWAAAGGGTFKTSNPMAPPVRVALRPVRPALRSDELGWLRPAPKSAAPAVPDRPAPARQDPVVAAVEPPAETPGWVWPASALAGWGAAVGVLVALMVRLPRATWPEQFGLVGGMFGMAVAGGWWVGPAAWAAARAAWAAEAVARRGRSQRTQGVALG